MQGKVVLEQYGCIHQVWTEGIKKSLNKKTLTAEIFDRAADSVNVDGFTSFNLKIVLFVRIISGSIDGVLGEVELGGKGY